MWECKLWGSGSESLLNVWTDYCVPNSPYTELPRLTKFPENSSRVIGPFSICRTWDFHTWQLFGADKERIFPISLEVSAITLKSLPSLCTSCSSLFYTVFSGCSSAAQPILVTCSVVSPRFIKTPSSVIMGLSDNHSFSVTLPFQWISEGMNQTDWQPLWK